MNFIWNKLKKNGGDNFQERYRKCKCIGAGSFGSVFLYEDKQTKEFVAIKEIFTGDGGFDEVRKEKIILEVLNSPNIVRLIGHFENTEENIFRLIMEYCSGGSLKDKMFNDNELLIIAEHILSGLAYMHSRGFIHRDIKPENLLCCDDEKERVYKLGDLGSSKSIEHSVKTYTGTVTFMAPEVRKLEYSQLKSGKGYNNKVDVWSFGATLLYLGEGGQCQIENNPKFKRIKNEKLRKVIKRCLIADPKKRSSVADLQRILESDDNDDENYGQKSQNRAGRHRARGCTILARNEWPYVEDTQYNDDDYESATVVKKSILEIQERDIESLYMDSMERSVEKTFSDVEKDLDQEPTIANVEMIHDSQPQMSAQKLVDVEEMKCDFEEFMKPQISARRTVNYGYYLFLTAQDYEIISPPVHEEKKEMDLNQANDELLLKEPIRDLSDENDTLEECEQIFVGGGQMMSVAGTSRRRRKIREKYRRLYSEHANAT